MARLSEKNDIIFLSKKHGVLKREKVSDDKKTKVGWSFLKSVALPVMVVIGIMVNQGVKMTRDVGFMGLGGEKEEIGFTVEDAVEELRTLTPQAYQEPPQEVLTPAPTILPTPTMESLVDLTRKDDVIDGYDVFYHDGMAVLNDRAVTAGGFYADTIGMARYSYYWPPLGGVNCEGSCIYMASGLRWEDYIGYAVACPKEFPIGTKFRLVGKVYECLDRGGAITYLEDGTFWLDFLTPEQEYPFWTVLVVEVDYPNQ